MELLLLKNSFGVNRNGTLCFKQWSPECPMEGEHKCLISSRSKVTKKCRRLGSRVVAGEEQLVECEWFTF